MKKIGKKTSLRRVMKWLNFKFLYLIFGYKNARKTSGTGAAFANHTK
ncbi:hypothetical protein [Xenorhabdus nematophila]|nr:hypothetical protein [Xenorhabdus nematophila]